MNAYIIKVYMYVVRFSSTTCPIRPQLPSSY